MKKSIGDIKKEFAEADRELVMELINNYIEDERKGVQNIIKKAWKKEQQYQEELKRLEIMRIFENKYPDCNMIAGIDEAGRGPFAGPVVAGAVILPKDCSILYLDDSKKLSASRRDELFEEIKEKAVAYGIGMASPERIDEINILQATYEAMREAISNMKTEPDIILADAVHIPDIPYRQVGIVHGDAQSISIAAASVLAKVTRDRIMEDMDQIYPEYGFSVHKGYGTKMHIEALQKYGPCPIHRTTFIKKYI